MSLDTSDESIKQALFNLKDKGQHLGWVLLGYVPKQDKIQVKEEGQGVVALKDSLSDGSIFWAYLRWDSDTLPKFIYISWCGEGVTGTRKGLFSSHATAMEKYFSTAGLTCHVTVNARVEDDIVEKDLGTKVAKAMGVSYDKAQGDKSRFQQASEGAGATFKQVKKAHGLVTKGSVAVKKTEVEVKQDQREEFWSKQRQADEQRRQQAQNNVPEARAEQTKLVKQREKFWKDNQAQKASAKVQREQKEYNVTSEERDKFWAQQQASQGGTQRAVENPDYKVSEEEKQRFWEQQNQKQAPPPAKASAPPAKIAPAKKFGGAPPPAANKAAPPPAKQAPPPAKATGPSPAELARQKAEEERKRKEEEEATRRQEEEAAARAAEEAAAEEEAAAAAAAEEEGGWGEEEASGWGEEEAAAEEEGYYYEEEEGGAAAAAEEEEAYYEEEEGAAAEEEGSYPRCQAISDWAAGNEGDLGLTTGDIIEVWDNSDAEGWWQGANVATGAQGYFPSTYVQLL